MLNQVDFPLTNSQISEFILDKGYTTYFKLQQALSDFWNRDLSEKSLHITVHFTILRRMVPRQSTISPTISHLRSSMILMNF